MSDRYWLTDEQMTRLQPCLPKIHDELQVDWRALSGIVSLTAMGCGGGMRPALMDRTRRCTTVESAGREGCVPEHDGGLGCRGCAAQNNNDRRDLPEDASQGSTRVKGDFGRLIGRTEGGMNTRLHAFSDANGRLLSFFTTAGQTSDYIGAATLLMICRGAMAAWQLWR
jgi:transposase